MDDYIQLKWCTRDDGVLYTKPSWLRWSYFIHPMREDMCGFELSIVDNDDIEEDKLIINTLTMERAQFHAQKHFERISGYY